MRLSTIVAASVAACLGLFVSAPAAHADSVVSGGTLMTQAYANQLASWLGEGDLVLTNIFSHVAGDGQASSAFHTAADGQGRTIVLMQVNAGIYYSYDYNSHQNYIADFPDQIIGGYNPQSWNNSGNWNITYYDPDRTAFIFNLSASVIQRQRLTSDAWNWLYGSVQTNNAGNFGPVFGLSDLTVYGNLNTGSVSQYSYSGPGLHYPLYESNILGLPGQIYFSLGGMEVYTIANAPSAVPTPAAAGGGVVLLGGMRLLRRRSQMA
jgi:hypothetical protein